MIEVIDRVPTYPGRVKLTPVSGQANTYDMQRADEPITVGTPLNKALFDSIRDELTTLNQNVANLITAHASLNPIGNLATGTEIGIYENGILVPYIKVTGDYNGTGRAGVIRKHIYKMDFVNMESSAYLNSACDVWLNNDFLGILDSTTRAAIAEVSITYFIPGSSTVHTANRKVFFPSAPECGATASSYVDGYPLPYFNSDARRVALYNGSPVEWWTRTVSPSTVWIRSVLGGGSFASGIPYSDQLGYRPMFTLPSDFEVTVDAPSTNNVMATAEVL
jgi:hypothetical protein